MKPLNSDLTNNAWDNFYNIVDDPEFAERSPEIIYRELKEQMRKPIFGDYLKRYVHRMAEIDGDYREKSTEYYQQIIVHAFKEKDVPCSFEATTTKTSAAIKNWLTRDNVSRKAVLLLGFGLSMSVEDVNTFLTKSIYEQELNPKDPLEAICLYCYKNQYGYITFVDLWEKYEALPAGMYLEEQFSLDATVNARNTLYLVQTEKGLMQYLSGLRSSTSKSRFSRTSKNEFDKLLAETKAIIAKLRNDAEMTKDMHAQKVFTADDISVGDIETTIYAGVPKTKNGNLIKENLSDLKDVFVSKRLSRQRISNIISLETDVTRFDLITLNFFIYSQKVDGFILAQKLYGDFFNATNNILRKCFMQELIIQNPYENFILSCMLSEDPLMTFSDVWENSFPSESTD